MPMLLQIRFRKHENLRFVLDDQYGRHLLGPVPR